MPFRVGFASAAHVHAWGYAASLPSLPDVAVSGVWDHDLARRSEFASRTSISAIETLEALLESSDALIVTSETSMHPELLRAAVDAGVPVLCEKPIAMSPDHDSQIRNAVGNNFVMTAFPCRYSPAWTRSMERIGAGELGQIRAVCSTNRGQCPFGWFVEQERSGGGALIDHVVHVADLLWLLLKEEPSKVQAQTGSNLLGLDCEDTAMLTLEYPGGVFASLDASWSRPKTFRTWGDVTMNIVGDAGVIEIDMFNQAVQLYQDGIVTHLAEPYGSDVARAMLSDFVRTAREGGPPPISVEDGLRAGRVVFDAYSSAGAVA